MSYSPTTSDTQTVHALASCEGDVAQMAKVLFIPLHIAEARVIRIARKAGLGYRQRTDPKILAVKLQAWLKEALATIDLIEKHRKTKLFKNKS